MTYGVVEPQWRAHAHAAACQLLAQCRIVDIHAGEDFLADGARVLGIDIDITGQQRVPHHSGSAELVAVGDGRPGRRRQPGDDLAENDPLGEGLGAHRDRNSGAAG